MKIVKYFTTVSKRLARAESWRFQRPTSSQHPALPAPSTSSSDVPPAAAVEENAAADVDEKQREEGEKGVEEGVNDDAPPKPKPKGKRRALLIGIQNYPDPSLIDTPASPPSGGPTSGQEPPAAPSIPPLPQPQLHGATMIGASAAMTTATTTATSVGTSVTSAAMSARASISTPATASTSTAVMGTASTTMKALETMTTIGAGSMTNTGGSVSNSGTVTSTGPTPGKARPLSKVQSMSYAAIVASTQKAKAKLIQSCTVSSPLKPPSNSAASPSIPSGSASTSTPLGTQSSSTTSNTASNPISAGSQPTSPTPRKVPLKPGRTPKAPKHKRELSATSVNSNTLKGCHRDVEDMERTLIDLYNYEPTDVTTMVDSASNISSNSKLLPTRENIIRRIEELVEGAEEGDRFFFFFAGHSTQQETDSEDEEDGKDELIVTYDNLTIQDDQLRELLVSPLPPGAKLTAVFDSCHSASLLDLEHFRCNRVWVPWINKGRRRSMTRLNAVVRRAAAPLSPRRLSPLSPNASNSPFSASWNQLTGGRPLSPIFDFERIRRVMSKKRRKEAREAVPAQPFSALDSDVRDKDKENVDVDASPTTANHRPKTNLNGRPDPRKRNTRRQKIVPPAIIPAGKWIKSSIDGIMGGGASFSSTGGSGPAPAATAANPTSVPPVAETGILASTNTAPAPASSPITGPNRKVKLPPIRTTSLKGEDGPSNPQARQRPRAPSSGAAPPPPPSNAGPSTNEVPTRPNTPLHQYTQHVTFTPQSSLPHDHVLAEKARGKTKSGDTHKTDRTDATDVTGRTDGTGVSDDSGVFWFVSEAEDGDGDGDDGEEVFSPLSAIQESGPASLGPLGVASSLPPAAGAAVGGASVPLVVQDARQESAKEGAETKDARGRGEGRSKKRRHRRRCLSPVDRFCTGWCRNQWDKQGKDGKTMWPFVISLSAAKDSQQAWEDATGASMTQHLIAILRKEPNPSLERLLGLISHDLHSTYLDIHSKARAYRKKAREYNRKMLLKGKKDKMQEATKVEMDNFQDPQVSSLWPLDMRGEIWDP